MEVLHAPTAPAFAANELAAVSQNRLGEIRFVPNPATRLLSLEYPANAFLQEFLDRKQPTIPGREGATVLVARKGYRIRRLEPQPSQATVLRRLLSGETLGSALLEVKSDSETVQGWFRQWTEWGAFSGARVGEAADPSCVP